MPTDRGYADAGMAALRQFYDPNRGLWTNDGRIEWWNSASVLDAAIDYCVRANSLTYFRPDLPVDTAHLFANDNCSAHLR
jgi:hypothetical protein